MLKVAITGGIASGKSTLTQYLMTSGYIVYSADRINAELLKDKRYISEIALAFPSAIKDNQIDKSTLRQIIAGSIPKALELNAIAHPIIRARFEELVSQNNQAEIIFFEVPLLVESGMQNLFDYIVTIETDIALRIDRAMQRDRLDKATVTGIISLQATDEDRLQSADMVIYNNGDEIDLQKQAIVMLKNIKNLL